MDSVLSDNQDLLDLKRKRYAHTVIMSNSECIILLRKRVAASGVQGGKSQNQISVYLSYRVQDYPPYVLDVLHSFADLNICEHCFMLPSPPPPLA